MVRKKKEIETGKEQLPNRGKMFDDEVKKRPEPLKVGSLANNLNLPDIASIESMINAEVKEEKESKEIFSIDDVEVRTELDDREISILSRLLYLCEEHSLTNLKMTLNNFMKLRISKKRRSRKEFIDSIKNPQMGTFPVTNGFNGQNSNMFK